MTFRRRQSRIDTDQSYFVLSNLAAEASRDLLGQSGPQRRNNCYQLPLARFSKTTCVNCLRIGYTPLL